MIKQAIFYGSVLTVLLVSAHPSRGENASLPILRSAIVVSSETISLSDLMQGDNIPNNGVYASPAPGQTGVIKASRIVEIAKKAGIPAILGDVAGSVTVTRKSRIIAPEDIEAALKQSIREKGDFQQAQISFAPVNAQQDVFVEEEATAQPIISNLKIDPASLRFTASLSVPGSKVLTKAPFMLEGQIIDLVDVAITNRPLAKSDIISANDIRVEKRERKALNGVNAIKPALVIGQAARDSMITGTLLSDDLVSKPMLVDKGMAVSVTYSVAGLKLTLRGKANEGGAMGDLISVLNPQSKKVIFATVVGPGSVSVLTPPNADMAQRQTTSTVQ
jgi:flagella basal body P-ring formation protein FlgA